MLVTDFPDFPELPLEQPEQAVVFHQEDVFVGLPDVAIITDWLQAVAEAEGKPLFEVNYIFCSDDYLLRVNREYLQHDYYTDVITFPYAKSRIEGDVYISTDRVAENAGSIGVNFEQELCRILVHGVLHLVGYTDKTEAERAAMTEKENFYLSKLKHGI